MVEFHPWSGINTSLDFVTHCYVPTPCLPCYYSTFLSHRSRSYSYLYVTCLRPIISRYCMISSAHLGVARIRPSIPTSRFSSLLLHQILLCGSLAPSPPFSSREISSKVSISSFCAAYWHQNTYLLCNPPL